MIQDYVRPSDGTFNVIEKETSGMKNTKLLQDNVSIFTNKHVANLCFVFAPHVSIKELVRLQPQFQLH